MLLQALLERICLTNIRFLCLSIQKNIHGWLINSVCDLREYGIIVMTNQEQLTNAIVDIYLPRISIVSPNKMVCTIFAMVLFNYSLFTAVLGALRGIYLCGTE